MLPDTRLVYVADRESNFIDLMAQASALSTPVDWLIRSAHNRKLAGQQEKIWDGFTQAHMLGEIRFHLPARKGPMCMPVTAPPHPSSRLQARLRNGVTLELACSQQDTRLLSALINALGRCNVPVAR